MKTLLQKKKDNPNDIFIKESLNQFMEDLKYKYKIGFTSHEFNLETGEIIEVKEKRSKTG